MPWCATSRVSVATFTVSKFRLGPVHRTGTTPTNDHSATFSSNRDFAEMTMVVGLTPFTMPANHLVNLALSAPLGRVSLTMEYFYRGCS